MGIRKFGLCINGLGFDNGVFFIELTLEFACIDLALATMSLPLTNEFRNFNLRILLVISFTTGVVYGIERDGLDLSSNPIDPVGLHVVTFSWAYVKGYNVCLATPSGQIESRALLGRTH